MRSRSLIILALSLCLGGCLQSTTVINIKPDGSGTIEQTMTMNPQTAAQLQQMASGFGQAEAAKKGFFNEQQLREAASKMGEGVTFVSAAPIKTPQAEGTKAIYAFADITKLRMNQKPPTPGGGGGMQQGVPGGSAREDMLFRFAKSPRTSTVTVVFPEAKLDQARKTKPAAEPAKAPDPMQGAALVMVKQMFAGFKATILLQPVGRIVKTNSDYVEGPRVTLLEMDLGQLINDDAMLQKLQSAGSLEEAKHLLQGVKGVKINSAREVSVEFAAR